MATKKCLTLSSFVSDLKKTYNKDYFKANRLCYGEIDHDDKKVKYIGTSFVLVRIPEQFEPYFDSDENILNLLGLRDVCTSIYRVNSNTMQSIVGNEALTAASPFTITIPLEEPSMFGKPVDSIIFSSDTTWAAFNKHYIDVAKAIYPQDSIYLNSHSTGFFKYRLEDAPDAIVCGIRLQDKYKGKIAAMSSKISFA